MRERGFFFRDAYCMGERVRASIRVEEEVEHSRKYKQKRA